jgi:RNA polymerase sigma-70 factor (ECF subfamily)
MTPDPPQDADLLQRFLAGDRGALGELAARYERSMLGVACGMFRGDPDAARDAVQSTWLRVIRYGRTFKGKSSVKTWLYTILLNECRAALASLPAQLRLATRNPADQRAVPDAELHLALDLLPQREREVLLVCYHPGMTHAIAAEVLGIPLGTLKSRLHSALEDLRAIMRTSEHEVVR